VELVLRLHQELDAVDAWSIIRSFRPKFRASETDQYLILAVELQQTFEEMEFPQPFSVATNIRTNLDNFKGHCGLVNALCNRELRPRHWDEISNIVGFQMEPDNSFTLSRIIDMEVGKHVEALTKVSEQATEESAAEKKLHQMGEEWHIVIPLTPWKDTGAYVLPLPALHTLQDTARDQTHILESMKIPVGEWEEWLELTTEILKYWEKVQNTWMSLEPFARRTPWKKITQSCFKEQVVAVMTSDLLRYLQDCEKRLEEVQTGLDARIRSYAPNESLSREEILRILAEEDEENEEEENEEEEIGEHEEDGKKEEEKIGETEEKAGNTEEDKVGEKEEDKVGQTEEKVAETEEKVPETVEKVPETVEKVPETEEKVPKTEEEKVPQNEEEKIPEVEEDSKSTIENL